MPLPRGFSTTPPARTTGRLQRIGPPSDLLAGSRSSRRRTTRWRCFRGSQLEAARRHETAERIASLHRAPGRLSPGLRFADRDPALLQGMLPGERAPRSGARRTLHRHGRFGDGDRDSEETRAWTPSLGAVHVRAQRTSVRPSSSTIAKSSLRGDHSRYENWDYDDFKTPTSTSRRPLPRYDCRAPVMRGFSSPTALTSTSPLPHFPPPDSRFAASRALRGLCVVNKSRHGVLRRRAQDVVHAESRSAPFGRHVRTFIPRAAVRQRSEGQAVLHRTAQPAIRKSPPGRREGGE